MKKTTLCSLFTFFVGFLAAQSVALDSTFGVNGKVVAGVSGLSGSPYGIDFGCLPDGKTILGGRIADFVGIEKYDNTGVLDPSFSNPLVESDGLDIGLFVQKDGKVLLTGENPVSLSTFVIRVDASGNLDPTFGNNGVAQTLISHFFARNVFGQSDGKVIVFGDEWTDFSSFSAVRFRSNGSLDSSFATNGKLSIDLPGYAHEVPVAMLEQADHKLLFAGSIGYPTWNIFMVRINPDGSRDNTFGEGGIVIDPIQGNSNAYGLAFQSDGKILLTGFTDPANQAIVVRYHATGIRDKTFGSLGVYYPPGLNEGVGIAVKPDGKILTLNWSVNNTVGNLALAQLLPNGQRDTTFGNNGIFRVIDPLVHPRALVLIGNKATVSARKPTGATFKRIYRFLLDLNVGTLNPNTPADPTLWVYPNPIAEQFNLQFALTQKAQVSVQLFDMQGKRVQTLVQNQSFESGEHILNLICPEYLPSGNYVLTLEVAGEKRTSVQVFKL